MATAYTNPTNGFKAWALQARTDAAGSAVDDADGEDARLLASLFTPGVVGADAFRVQQRGAGANMSVDVGSGDAETDIAIVAGTSAGQGNYTVRLGDAETNLSVPASNLSNPRIDAVYLVVRDNAYDSSSRVLPQLAYIDGTPAAVPVAPSPDASWDAYLLLATVAVAAGATSIVDANITDARVYAATDVRGEADQASIVQTGSTIVTPLIGNGFNTVLSGSYVPPSNWNTYRLQVSFMVFFTALSGQRPSIRAQIGGVAGGTVDPTGNTFGLAVPIATAAQRSGLSGTVAVTAQARVPTGDPGSAICTMILMQAIRES